MEYKDSDYSISNIFDRLKSDLLNKVDINLYISILGQIHGGVYYHVTPFHQILEIMGRNTIDLIK